MKKFLVGCGFVLVLLAAVVAFIYLSWPKITKRVTGFAQEMMKASEEKAKFEAAWTPPSPQPDEQWFPSELAEWKRENAAPITEIPELKLTKEGYSATYRRSGQRVDLKIVAVTD